MKKGFESVKRRLALYFFFLFHGPIYPDSLILSLLVMKYVSRQWPIGRARETRPCFFFCICDFGEGCLNLFCFCAWKNSTLLCDERQTGFFLWYRVLVVYLVG
ncbi:MAG: hypothetical protein BYD32DRAFT_166894 [Podila humilis]|nr:MAG: hypothetical protein BYD32DRAFT_166894 [Podila humilis]